MAKKKKRPRQRPPAAPQAAARGGVDRGSAAHGGAARGGANIARRGRKEQARRLREAERRRARRASALRRTVTSIGIAAAAVTAITLFRSFQGPNDIPAAATRAAENAGCSSIEHRPDLTPPPPENHLSPGETITYPDPPATSGAHNPSPLPDDPKVFTSPLDETAAVHSMEHGAVFVYYLPEANGGLTQGVIDRLADIASASNATFLAPYPNLTPETALTLTAWNYRQSCPTASTTDGTTLTPGTAATIVEGFVTGFECTGEAPENGASPC
jgi:uncharacterized protein DUF3105